MTTVLDASTIERRLACVLDRDPSSGETCSVLQRDLPGPAQHTPGAAPDQRRADGHHRGAHQPPPRAARIRRESCRMSTHPKAQTTCAACGATFLGLVAPRPRWRPTCRPEHRASGAPKYVWTPERDAELRTRYDGRVRRRAAEIARDFGWPLWAVRKRAQQLGISRPWPAGRKNWTALEVAFLRQWSGRRASIWIARQLHRSETSVVVQQKRLDLARRVREGYTLRDLCACFGVDHHAIERWARLGWLSVERRPTRRTDKQGDPWSIAEAAVVAFVKTHPEEIDLRKVDPAWFFDVVVNAPLPASATQRTRGAVGAVRQVLQRLTVGEDFTTAEMHARVTLPAHDVRLALRTLLQEGDVTRVWRAVRARRSPEGVMTGLVIILGALAVSQVLWLWHMGRLRAPPRGGRPRRAGAAAPARRLGSPGPWAQPERAPGGCAPRLARREDSAGGHHCRVSPVAVMSVAA